MNLVEPELFHMHLNIKLNYRHLFSINNYSNFIEEITCASLHKREKIHFNVVQVLTDRMTPKKNEPLEEAQFLE